MPATPRPVPTDMAEHGLDHVRRHAEALVQRGRDRAAEIVQGPVRQRLPLRRSDARVEIGLAARPILKAARAAAEHQIAWVPSLGAARLGRQDGARRPDRGMTCSRLFLVRAGGSVIVSASMSTSDQRSDAISSRRAPVSISSFTIAPY